MGAVSTPDAAPRIAPGDGTCEQAWRDWLDAQPLPCVQAQALVPPASRAVVVAPHPDDETLMVGGLLALLAARGRRIAIVAVTDGEASHAGSSTWTPPALACRRSIESAQALRLLGVHAAMHRLGMPDGGVAARAGLLARRLHALLQPGDVVFTTWRHDGHPDHEATARAARAAAAALRLRLWEVPVWGWHWAPVADPRLPWDRAHVLPLAPQVVQRKCAALDAYASQWRPDPDCPHTPVLRPSTRRRAQRPYEVLFA